VQGREWYTGAATPVKRQRGEAARTHTAFTRRYLQEECALECQQRSRRCNSRRFRSAQSRPGTAAVAANPQAKNGRPAGAAQSASASSPSVRQCPGAASHAVPSQTPTPGPDAAARKAPVASTVYCSAQQRERNEGSAAQTRRPYVAVRRSVGSGSPRRRHSRPYMSLLSANPAECGYSSEKRQ